MKLSNAEIVPLKTEAAEKARRDAAAGAADHAEVVTDVARCYPCRHCLQWAQIGERLILFPFACVPAENPYSETGPIFVHAEACQRYADIEMYPESFREGRVLRAYNAYLEMVDAIVVNVDGPEAAIEALLRNPAINSIHVRSVTRGCYTMGIERSCK